MPADSKHSPNNTYCMGLGVLSMSQGTAVPGSAGTARSHLMGMRATSTCPQLRQKKNPCPGKRAGRGVGEREQTCKESVCLIVYLPDSSLLAF